MKTLKEILKADRIEKLIDTTDRKSSRALSAAVHSVDYSLAFKILRKHANAADTQTALDRLFGEDF